ncbi:Reverse transcriptase (RNA-dependent DNA polymerase) [Popillia japonica]|uniref:Reverse transcriptase (RNA-dependent DNA polymerase) n=1 Tax=Popillia japonica TaxID=7064 RepID=A0AAW1LBZ9_POPJA
MLELGIIERSHGSWSSPVLLVKKASGEYRFCFDGRALNAVTKPDRYPLPRVDRILSLLTDAHFISSIDLKSAFWQIPLDEESKDRTGFAIPGRGMFQKAHFGRYPLMRSRRTAPVLRYPEEECFDLRSCPSDFVTLLKLNNA